MESGDATRQARVVWQLIRHAHVRLLEPLIIATSIPDEYWRARACEALGPLGDARAIEPLLVRTQDRSRDVRASAARALGHFSDPRIVPALLPLLQDRVMAVRAGAADGMRASCDPRAFDPLLGLLQENYRAARVAAAQALGRLRDARAVEPLLARLPLEKKFYDVRMAIYQALGEIGDARAYETLITRISEASAEVRAAVFTALGALGDARAVMPILELYRFDPDRMPPAARQALERLGIGTLLAALHAVLHGQDESALMAVIRRGGDEGTLAGRVMAKWITRRDVRIRRTACRLLGLLGDAAAVKLLSTCLNDPVAEVREAACAALGQVGDGKVAAKVAARAGDPSPAVRAAAIVALAALGDAETADALRAMFRGDSAALAALLLADQHPVGRPLVELLARPGFDFGLQRALRALFACIWAAQADVAPRMFCRSCLLRPTPRDYRRWFQLPVRILTCRGCGDVLHFKQDITEVVAVLDAAGGGKAVSIRNGVARVNALQQQAPFDYDRVEIIDASDFAIERFCMSAGNDTDRHRAARRRQIPVTVRLAVSENARRVLDHIFGEVVVVE